MAHEEVAGARMAPQNLASKIAMLRKLFPDTDADRFAERIASIDTKPGSRRVIVHMHDHDRIDFEPENSRVRQFGVGHHAKGLAMALANSTMARFSQQPIEEWGRGQRPGSPAKFVGLSREEAETIASRWRERGYTEVSVSPGGVWVQVDEGAVLRDRDTEVHLHGKTTDEAIKALMTKAVKDWNGRIELIGSDDYKARAWAIAQEVGVIVIGYDPAELVGGKLPSEEFSPTLPVQRATSPLSDADTSTIIQQGAVASASSQGHPQPIEPQIVLTQTPVPAKPVSVETPAPAVIDPENVELSASLLKADDDEDDDFEPFSNSGPSM